MINFIVSPNFPNDWRIPQNDNLWQGVNGKNNPCPSGFRVPTDTEWQEEIDSWSSKDTTGAFASPLKLVTAYFTDTGVYWSSTIDPLYNRASRLMLANPSSAYTSSTYVRQYGFSVRCIKN